MNKPHPDSNIGEGATDAKTQKKTKRPRPRGFGLEMEPNEFDDEPSWFEAVTSTIVINSGHPRYLARYTMSQGKRMREILAYIAELYLWEISKLAFREETPDKIGSKFLSLKFKYFESNSSTGKSILSEEEKADENGKAIASNE